MSCPVCRQRKGKRTCPALGGTICSVCCGTKRIVEIDCPADCVHLATSREHPAAVVRRQQEHDVALLLPSIQRLSERQHQLFFVLHTLIARHKPEGLIRLLDDDVADAAGALAATLETSARGVIYEHAPQSLPAQRLAAEIRTMLAEMAQQGATVPERELSLTLRAIEQGARDTRARVDGGDTAYLDLMARLLQMNRTQAGDEPRQKPASSLILP
jgi:hypothetical protein